MNDRTDAVLAAIDGALMDPEIPDGMRWSPEPHTATDAGVPYDGELVPIPPQAYERVVNPLPPGASMLLAQLRAEYAQLRAERGLLITAGVPPLALVEPLDPDAPRASNHNPPRRPATPEEIQAIWKALVEAFRPVGETIRSVSHALERISAGAGIPRLPPPTSPEGRANLGLPPGTEEERRQAALAHRARQGVLGVGPAPLGPERSPRPRRHR